MHAIYLRKSRLDVNYAEDTLKRHEETLKEFAKTHSYSVSKIYREVVSGETLTARPQMQQLLNDVTQGFYEGIICMDVDRLSRGSSLDSGYIMQVLQAYNCKIITPAKIYDLNTDSDEQFTDLQFMLSRFELKTITKRLVRGRATSTREGKYIGSTAPYGYERMKLAGTKGYTLAIVEDQARIVRKIFEWYIDGKGYGTIAEELNKIDVTKKWTKASVVHIVTNPVYCGLLRWGATPLKREIKNGVVVKKREHKLNDCELHQGLHKPIISTETFNKATAVRNSRTFSTTNIHKEITNPFANLMYCGNCGQAVHMNVCGKNRNTRPWYFCKNKKCDCRSTKHDIIENAVLTKLKEWFKGYKVEVKNYSSAPAVDAEKLEKQLSDLKAQQTKLCELLETGVYDVDLFTERNNVLKDSIKNCRKAIKNARRTMSEYEDDITPYCEELFTLYDVLDVPTKNKLLKKIVAKIEYYRKRDTDDIYIEIYPRVR